MIKPEELTTLSKEIAEEENPATLLTLKTLVEVRLIVLQKQAKEKEKC